MSDTIKKDELDSILWALVERLTIHMAQGGEVDPNKFLGILSVIDLLKERFDLSIKMDGLQKVLEEVRADLK